MVNRQGNMVESNMTTTKLITIYRPNTILRFKNNNLTIVDNINASQYINQSITTIPTTPPYCEINGYIVDSSIVNNNILGFNNILCIDNNTIDLPIIKATKETLLFYDSHLLYNDDVFILKGEYDVGLFEMNIGKNYLDNYLYVEGYGDGLYIETHNQPHYYNAINNNSGFLILGKKVENKYILTGFTIPDNMAIYVEPNVYHCDGCLIGNYNVIYSKTDNYKTLLIHNNENKIVKLNKMYYK